MYKQKKIPIIEIMQPRPLELPVEAGAPPGDRWREESRCQEVRDDLRGLQAQQRARLHDGRLPPATSGARTREVSRDCQLDC